jgi:Stress responsive A/B Barrel Domain
MTTPRLAHHVFFTLEDASETKVAALIAACQKYLVDHDGVIDFSVGRRDPELDRPVNARYDVSLHVIFRDRQSHDVYQTAPLHLKFIEQEKANWKQVQVCDSTLET